MIEGRVSLVGLPLCTQSKYYGIARAVPTLRKLGIVDVVREHSEGFRDRGDVKLSEITEDSGPQNLRNFPQFVEDTNKVYKALAGWTDPEDSVFCLGGECGMITGSMAAFKERFEGTPGVLWLDAHGDFNIPATSPSGFIGGMCLAFTCGRGPSLSDEIEESRPLVSDQNVIHVGSRALDPDEAKLMENSAIELYSASNVHRAGTKQLAETVARSLLDRCDWIVCHLDLDVIDPRAMPAVNFPASGEALTVEDVVTIVKALRDTRKLKVMNLAAYNPMMDNYNYEAGMKILKLASEILS